MIKFNVCKKADAMNDEQLVTECAKNSAIAQRMLFDKFAPKMMAVCLRYVKNQMEAEDILQDGFVKIFAKISAFKNDGSLEGWIRRIMVNTALDAIRKNKRILSDTDIDDVSYKIAYKDHSFDSMDLQRLLEIISELPDGYRVVFNMFAIEGYSHKEIADTLGVTENTSKSQYSRARAYLQNQLEKLERE